MVASKHDFTGSLFQNYYELEVKFAFLRRSNIFTGDDHTDMPIR